MSAFNRGGRYECFWCSPPSGIGVALTLVKRNPSRRKLSLYIIRKRSKDAAKILAQSVTSRSSEDRRRQREAGSVSCSNNGKETDNYSCRRPRCKVAKMALTTVVHFDGA